MAEIPVAAAGKLKLSDINILDIGNVYQIAGVIYAASSHALVCWFPDSHDDAELPASDLLMDEADWQKFLQQSDMLHTEIHGKEADGSAAKAIVRKSQRQIDLGVSWSVFKRDGYRCRYCGKDGIPMTVDHIVLWEAGGPSTVENLVTACRKCNKLRGNTPYPDWLASKTYAKLSHGKLTAEVLTANVELLDKLSSIARVSYIRSR